MTEVLDVSRVKADFPIFERKVNGKPLVYLDSASSSQKPRSVLDAMERPQAQPMSTNRRHVQGSYGQRLLRKRGELLERSFAHCYETGRMRRTHLRGHKNILKRLLIHVGAFNLSLIFRTLLGSGTPRELRNRQSALIFLFLWSFRRTSAPAQHTSSTFSPSPFGCHRNHRYLRYKLRHSGKCDSATDC